MKCTLCGYEFNEQNAQTSCTNCPVKKNCKLIRCPNCGFENPPEPENIKWFLKYCSDFYKKIKKSADEHR